LRNGRLTLDSVAAELKIPEFLTIDAPPRKRILIKAVASFCCFPAAFRFSKENNVRDRAKGVHAVGVGFPFHATTDAMEHDAITVFLCGDVMTGRGIDQGFAVSGKSSAV
jgi:hypothetical protein